MELPPLITGPWTIADLTSGKVGSPKHGLKVFSCFHCGGGSSFGYKLAGFDVLGGVEIDPEMMAIYRANHHPRHSYLMGVQNFKKLPTLPDELYNLDVLDGSPPCSSFSMAGSREKAWGEKKKFREGQAEQVLDDLFFHFIDIAKRLQPKIVIAENVKGLIQGNARGYVKEIFSAFRSAGYETQLFLLNASRMGVPQARERTFFVARRTNLGLSKLSLDFNEPVLTVRTALEGAEELTSKPLSGKSLDLWRATPPGSSLSKAAGGSWFTWTRLSLSKPANTVHSGPAQLHPTKPRHLSDAEHFRLQSFPDDYDHKKVEARYVCGMSVPPFMMQRVASKVAELLLSNPAST